MKKVLEKLAHIIGFGTAYGVDNLLGVTNIGDYNYSDFNHCYGIRPIITLTSGVYIESGTGEEGDPYILGKE